MTGPGSPGSTARARWLHWAIWPIIGLAFMLRLVGSDSNLPYLYNPGESIVVRQALAFGGGSLHPYSFIYPPLYSYALFGLYGAYYVIGKTLGAFGSVGDFAVSYFLDPTPFYWMGRVLTALLGVATVALVYFVARRAYGRGVGLLAALFLAVSHLHVVHSHYVLTDVPMTFLVTLAFLLILVAKERGSILAWGVAGFGIGLAAAMKYPAVIMGFPLLLGAWQWRRERAQSWRALAGRLGMGIGGAAIGFALANPYAIIDYRGLLTDLFSTQLNLNQGIAMSFGQILLSYLNTLFGTGLGPLLAAVALLGLSYLAWRHRAVDVLILSFPLAYVAFLGIQGRYQPNWLLPALPFLGIAAAVALRDAVSLLHGRAREVAPFVAAVVLIAYPAWYSYFHVHSILEEDTRTLAKEWVEANIAPGSRILLDSSTTGPPLYPTVASFQRYFQNAAQDKAIAERSTEAQAAFGSYEQYQLEAASLRAQESVTYDLDYMQLAWWRPDEAGEDLEDYPVFGVYRERIYSLAQIREAGVGYVIVSSFQYRKYTTPEAKEEWPTYYEFYRSLDETAQLVQAFYADPIHQPGPDIKIYRLLP